MRNNQHKQPQGFDRPELHVTLPRRDFTRMSPRQLVREGRRMYANLQAIWRAELRLPSPNWRILESVTYQMKLLEERCPEVRKP